MNLRYIRDQKTMLLRAAALRNTDLTDFASREARAVLEEAERVVLSGRDSLRVLDMLEHPPAPNAKLRQAIAALPKRRRSPDPRRSLRQ